jgi:hypothetical protein
MKKIICAVLLFGSIAANATTVMLDVDNSLSEQINGIITAEQISEIDLVDQVVIANPHVKLSTAIRVGELKTDSLVLEANDETAGIICKTFGYGSLVKDSILTTASRYHVIGKIMAVNGVLSFSPGPFGRKILSMTCSKS